MPILASLISSLNEHPLAGLMLVITLGYSLGRLPVRGIVLGPAGGTLAVAILFGVLGLDFSQFYGSEDPHLTLGAFGFALFIYSVGFEAGPRFFSSLAGQAGWQIVAVAVLVNVLAVVVVVLGGSLFGLSDSVTAGVLAGSLTSAPTYAAAAEVCSDRDALALSFAMTYPLGLIGLVLAISLLPRWMGDDLAKASPHEDDNDDPTTSDPEVTRAYVVDREEVCGRPLSELDTPHRTGCYLVQILRLRDVIVPHGDTQLVPGDRLLVKGRIEELREFETYVGHEIDDRVFMQMLPPPRRVRVLSGEISGRALSELAMFSQSDVLVTSIDRAGIVHEPAAEFVIQRADILELVGPRNKVRELADRIGRFEESTDQTDIAVYAGGIFLGSLLAQLHFGVAGLDLSVGYAGGLLFVGVLLGRFQRIGRLRTHVPRPARQLVRDLGILLLVAETGVKAGGSDLSTIASSVAPALLVGISTLILPVVAVVFLARRLLAMRAAETWGAIGGAMTSSAALVAVRRAADSNAPALSYAGSYAIASVLVTLAGQVVVHLMK